MNRPEILAPAGSMESLTAAVRCGADGVYIGGKRFSARAAADNFSDEELYTAAEYCHLHGVKLYRAMNTVIFDSEAQAFADAVRVSADAGMDGLIIQDIGAAYIARTVCPDMPLHASTQMTIETPLAAVFAADLGFCRTVPARESSLETIRDICATGIETEVFVHGAQCMCLSGQCYMSALIGSRSANRGRCAQACRLPFTTGNDKDEHALSLKDMSLLYHTDELIGAGAASFKIEGRMKRPEYVAAAVTAFRHAVDGSGDLKKDMQMLASVFSRSGFTDGYLTGEVLPDMFGFRRYEDVKAAESVLPSLRELYKSERKCASIYFTFTAAEGKPLKAGFECDGISGEITGNAPERALKRETTAADVEKSFSKLGDTIYEYGGTRTDIQGGLAVSAAELNRLRRDMCAEADRLMTEKNRRIYETHPFDVPAVRDAGHREPSLRVRISRREDLDIGADMLIAPISMILSGVPFGKNVSVSLPAIVTDEERLLRDIDTAVKTGYDHFHADNFTHLGILRKFDVHIHGGSGLNITNSLALSELAKAGLEDSVLSFELRREQIESMAKPIPCGIIVYGRLPLMTVRNIPLGSKVTDRTGRTFPIKRWGYYAEIQNCDTLDVISSFDGFGANFAEIALCDDPRDAVKRFRERKSLTGRGYTNGLYKRGII